MKERKNKVSQVGVKSETERKNGELNKISLAHTPTPTPTKEKEKTKN